MKKVEIKKQIRNDYIDFLRGIAAIGIISIHTAFWSGESYTPQWFRNLTLFLDVPFFFFLSGWGSGYGKIELKKVLISLGRIFSKWIFFVLFAEICSLILISIGMLPVTAGLKDVRDFVENVFFHVSFPGFPVISGSIWFMPVYFVVVICNTIVITIVGIERFKAEAETYLILIIALFVWGWFGNSLLGLDISPILFYSIFWMIGFCISKQQEGKKYGFKVFFINIVIAIIGIIITNYLQELSIYDIQSAKFPPSPKYAFVSLISIEVAKVCQNRINCGKIYHLITHIGKNAIFYFFGQGMGSSFIYLFVRTFETDVWFFKWILAFIINIISTVIFAEILRIIYKLLSEVVNNIVRNVNKDAR